MSAEVCSLFFAFQNNKNHVIARLYSVVVSCDVDYDGDAHFEAEVGTTFANDRDSHNSFFKV